MILHPHEAARLQQIEAQRAVELAADDPHFGARLLSASVAALAAAQQPARAAEAPEELPLDLATKILEHEISKRKVARNPRAATPRKTAARAKPAARATRASVTRNDHDLARLDALARALGARDLADVARSHTTTQNQEHNVTKSDIQMLEDLQRAQQRIELDRKMGLASAESQGSPQWLSGNRFALPASPAAARALSERRVQK